MDARMLTQLNVETRDHHADADAGWLALLVPDLTKARYMRQLANVYGFDGPLESAFAYTPGLDQVIRGREHGTCGLLALDLLHLGMTPSQLSQIAQCYWLTPFHTVAEALGWMYVAERGALLHAAVRHHVNNVMPDAPVAYLSRNQGESPARWKAFGVALDRFVDHSGQSAEIVAAAHEAFRVHRSWIRGEQATKLA
jgi:heme oxygenase